MTTRQEIVNRARQEIGTPWQHQARLAGVAVDCHGFLGVVGEACGIAEAKAWLADDELMRYGRPPRPDRLVAGAGRYLDPIPVSEAIEGDILMLAHAKHPKTPTHLAIVSCAKPLRIIHAEYFAGRVVENILHAYWLPTHAFRFRGIE